MDRDDTPCRPPAETASRLLDEACGEVFPGCAAAVRAGVAAWDFAAGHLGYGDLASLPVTSDTIYDVASVTKAVATAPLYLLLIARGLVRLDDPLTRFLHGFDARITLHHLLAHRSGLPAWNPYYRPFLAHAQPSSAPGEVRAAFLEAFRAEVLLAAPGERELYSDLNYLLLGWIAEQVAGLPLDRLFAEWIAAPLGLGCRFGPLPPDERVAPTEVNAERGLVHGAVHDENAFVLGGVAGHAGLFSTAADVARVGVELLRARRGESAVFNVDITRLFLDAPRPRPPESRVPGFDTPAPHGSSAGRHFGPGSFGHLGFTGCSLWCDPDRDLVAVLLSNRVHPTRDNQAIRELRPRFHDALEAPAFFP
jgi:CubicO group peptidase (beta-lactamase class C family)